jgi:hypothetical protein
MRDPPLCSLQELQSGRYSINDLADMHEAMDEEDEYRARYDDLNKPPGGRR